MRDKYSPELLLNNGSLSLLFKKGVREFFTVVQSGIDEDEMVVGHTI